MNEPIITETDVKKLKPLDHLVCGWPLILMIIGGALGGLCGGAAYGINIKIFTKNLPSSRKYLFTALVGIASIGVYFLVLIILAILFPEIFAKQ